MRALAISEITGVSGASLDNEYNQYYTPQRYALNDIQTVTITGSWGDVWTAQFMYGVEMMGAYMFGSLAGVAAGWAAAAVCEAATTPANGGCLVVGAVVGGVVGNVTTDWAKDIVQQ